MLLLVHLNGLVLVHLNICVLKKGCFFDFANIPVENKSVLYGEYIVAL